MLKMRKKTLFIFIIVLSCHGSILAGVVLSNPSDTNFFDIGLYHFESGRFQDAYDNFFLALVDDPGNLELNFYLGRAAFQIKDYEMAVMAFERILLVSPNENRVKLELALAFQRLGSNDLARQYCREVLASKPPETVKNNIEKFLAHIDKTEQEHFINGQLSVGVDWNNNIWSSPSNDTIDTILGDMVLKGSSSQKQEDWIYNTTLGIRHTYQVPYSKFSWKTQSNLYNALHNKTNELDIRYFGGQTGPQLAYDRNRYNIMFLLNDMTLDKEPYFTSIGVQTAWEHILNLHAVMGTVFKVEEKDYPGKPDRDSKNVSLALNAKLNLDHVFCNLNLKAEKESAFDEGYDYNKYVSNIAVTRELPFQIIGSVNYGYQYLGYDKVATLFGKTRQDHQHSAGISLEKRIWKSLADLNRFVSIRMSYQQVRNFSNIDLYEFDKDFVQLSIAYNF